MSTTNAFLARIGELNVENAKLRFIAGRMLHELQRLARGEPLNAQRITVLDTMCVLANIEPKERS